MLRRKIAFNIGLAAATMMSAFVAARVYQSPPWDEVRDVPLTQAEVSLIKGIFGDQIQLDQVFKRFHSVGNNGTAASVWVDPRDWVMARIGLPRTKSHRLIDFWGEAYHSNDFTKEENPFKFSILPHESTHIWQSQTGRVFTNGRCGLNLRYSLRGERRFQDYCDEQQAGLIEDYARRFLMPLSASSRWQDYDTAQSDARLQKIVEDQFPAAKQTRLRIQAERQQRLAAPGLEG